MKKQTWMMIGVPLTLIGLAVGAVAIAVATFDVDAYRPNIEQALQAQLGRKVTLGGPIEVGYSVTQGAYLRLEKVGLSNPGWASRPVMVSIGHVEVGIGLWPLLHRQIDVRSFRLKDADVLLETNASGRGNWEFEAAQKKQAAQPSQKGGQQEVVAASGGSSAAMQAAQNSGNELGVGGAPVLQLGNVTVTNSRMAFRDAKGAVHAFAVERLALTSKGKGQALQVTAKVDGAPLQVELVADKPFAELSQGQGGFDMKVDYAALQLTMKGTFDALSKQLIAQTYALAAGDSRLSGQLSVAYGGIRPVIKGTLLGQKVALSDFALPGTSGQEAVTEAGAEKAAKEAGGQTSSSSPHRRVFDDTPLALDGLKAADVHLDVRVATLAAGLSELTDFHTKIDLTDGRLLLSPFQAKIGGAPMEGQLKVDASVKPAQLMVLLKAYNVDLAQLVRLGGLSSFMETKGDVDLDLASSGQTPHELASRADGQLRLVMAGGVVSGQKMRSMAGDLLNLFAAGTGNLVNPGLNCMVAHLKVTNGVMQSQGLLVDTAQATIAGTGGVDFRQESIAMLLRARSKSVNVGALAPPVRIGGTLADPSYSVDAASSVQKVVGLLSTGKLDESDVPEIVQQAGQNACEYTLTHASPKKTDSSQNAVEKAAGRVKDKVKETGSRLLHGLFGK